MERTLLPPNTTRPLPSPLTKTHETSSPATPTQTKTQRPKTMIMKKVVINMTVNSMKVTTIWNILLMHLLQVKSLQRI